MEAELNTLTESELKKMRSIALNVVAAVDAGSDVQVGTVAKMVEPQPKISSHGGFTVHAIGVAIKKHHKALVDGWKKIALPDNNVAKKGSIEKPTKHENLTRYHVLIIVGLALMLVALFFIRMKYGESLF